MDLLQNPFCPYFMSEDQLAKFEDEHVCWSVVGDSDRAVMLIYNSWFYVHLVLGAK